MFNLTKQNLGPFNHSNIISGKLRVAVWVACCWLPFRCVCIMCKMHCVAQQHSASLHALEGSPHSCTAPPLQPLPHMGGWEMTPSTKRVARLSSAVPRTWGVQERRIALCLVHLRCSHAHWCSHEGGVLERVKGGVVDCSPPSRLRKGSPQPNQGYQPYRRELQGS